MKNLIVVRHGNYAKDSGKLTNVGEKQIEKLAKFMKTLKGSYYFSSSKAERAVESASILIDRLNIANLSIWEDLFDEEEYLTLNKAKKIDKKVEQVRGVENTLVLVSHFSVATGYSTYFMQKEFGDIRGIDNIQKGKAVLVSIVNKDYDIIPN